MNPAARAAMKQTQLFLETRSPRTAKGAWRLVDNFQAQYPEARSLIRWLGITARKHYGNRPCRKVGLRTFRFRVVRQRKQGLALLGRNLLGSVSPRGFVG